MCKTHKKVKAPFKGKYKKQHTIKKSTAKQALLKNGKAKAENIAKNQINQSV